MWAARHFTSTDQWLARLSRGALRDRLEMAPEDRELLTEFPALRESVGCWPLAIITQDAIGGTP